MAIALRNYDDIIVILIAVLMTSSQIFTNNIYYKIAFSMSRIPPLFNSQPQPQNLPQPSHNQSEQRTLTKHKGISKGEKKKFKTRIKQFNPKSSSCLIESYDSECFAQYDAISSRQKNNIAARTSRKRKKMYIQLLQQQNTNLQLQLYQINQQIEMQRSEIFNAIMHTDQLNSKSGQIQNLVTKKLRTLSQMQASPQTDAQINICLDSCIYRIGASGSERRAILDILYKGFINRNLPNNYRFILWAAIHRFSIYSTEKSTGAWWEFIKSDLMSRFQHFFADKGHILEEKGRQILKCSAQILLIKRQIQQAAQLYDRFLKEIREILTPKQSAELFLYADRATPKPQLQIFQQPSLDRHDQSFCEILPSPWSGKKVLIDLMKKKRVIQLQDAQS